MKKGRYAASRQRACQQCARSKTKCKPTPDGCARCHEHGWTCSLLTLQTVTETQINSHTNIIQSQILSQASENANLIQSQALSQIGSPVDGDTEHIRLSILLQSDAHTDIPQSPTVPQSTNATNITDEKISKLLNEPATISPVESSYPEIDIELICTINARDIRNRWLNAFAPEPGQISKEYPKHVVSFIFRILKSYAASLARGIVIPPFIHPSHAEKPAIQRALTLIQTCTRFSGRTASLLAEVLEREIDKTYGPPDYATIRQDFQANLIYMLVLYFSYELDPEAKTLFRRGIVKLQDLACVSSETGIVCLAERDGVRPRWESWIEAETQRRCIYLMYMFDNLLSAKDGLQTFLGTELAGLPAPSARDLWYAQTRQEWETLYDGRLEVKTIPVITVDYLWPSPADLSVLERKQRQKMVDRWLESVDEFGTMLYAVTCCTHGD